MNDQAGIRLRATKKTVWILSIGVLILWAANLVAFFLWPTGVSDARGTFGDVFGASASLFSAAAFAGLIIAILLQKEELEHQREELKLTREEMQGQKQQLEGQKQQMEIQNFENRFFQMLGAWENVLKSFSVGGSRMGREAFKSVAGDITRSFQYEASNNISMSDLGIIDQVFIRMYAGHANAVTTYMRPLYNIVKMIDRAQLEYEDKKFYSNIVRAQLSQQEMFVIFYNCLSRYGRDKFKPLVEKYSLLKHLDTADLVKQTHRQLYDDNAFR